MNPWWKKTEDEDDPQEEVLSRETVDNPSKDSQEAQSALSGSEAQAVPTSPPTPADGEPDTEPKSAAATRAKNTVPAPLTQKEAPSGEEAEEPKPRSRRRAPRKRTSGSAASPAKTATKARETAAAKAAPAESEEGAAKKPARRRQSRAKKNGEPTTPAPRTPAPRTPAPKTPVPEPTASAPSDLLEFLRDALPAAPVHSPAASDERKIGLFCDLENVALGLKDSDIPKFDIHLVLERLLEKGKIIVKRAYADWERYSEYKKTLHGAAIELIDIPQKYYSGKNSADIKLVVDAMELSASKDHIDTFVILSGDSDFSPLVSKLKENDKHVIGVGMKNSSSKLLIDNCDEFIFYEDLWRDSRQQAPKVEGLDDKRAEVFALMNDSIQALVRENKDVLWGSMIKQTMQRKRPSFNEGYYGYGSFSELLEDAEKRKVVSLKKDHRSGSYIVTGFQRMK